MEKENTNTNGGQLMKWKTFIIVLASVIIVVSLYFIYKYFFNQKPMEVLVGEKNKDIDILEYPPPPPPAPTPPTPTTSKPKPKPKPKPKCNDRDPNKVINKVIVLKKGSRGTEVCALQTILNIAAKQKKIMELVADGVFGAKTETMLKNLGYWSSSITIAQAQSYIFREYGITPKY